MEVIDRTETPQQAARRLAAPTLRKGYKPTGLHEYTSASGEPLFWRIRAEHATEPKWIRGMRQEESGEFVLREPEFARGRKPLYRLHLLASCPDDVVIVTEGEGKADMLERIGCTVTTSGSASSADGADWSPLSGRRVVIWPDNDDPGLKYAEIVAAKLHGIAADVRIIDVARLNLPPKGDAEEWLQAHPGATADDVLALPVIQSEVAEQWPEPQELVAEVQPDDYPLDALPAPILAAVQEVQGFTRAPLPLVASAALSAVSVAVQGLYDIKRADRLTGPCSLFLLTIAESGERKTTADGFFTKALRDFEAEQAEAAKPAIKEFKSEMAAWEAEKSGLQDAIRAAARNGKPAADLAAKLRDLVNDEPQPPRVPRLLYGDATPEALTWGLSKTWPTAAVISSEAGTVLGSHGMGAESMTRNFSILNQLWDGRDIPIDRRKEGGSFTVRGARLTMALQVQELTLRQFFERTAGLARGIGFLARFLVAWPASTQGTRFFQAAPEQWPALAAFNRRMSEILRAALPMNDAGELEPVLLGFAPDAFEAWRTFHDGIEAMLCIGGELSDVRDVASKTADNAARLALLFHVFEGTPGAVSLEAFNGAARIVAWHLSEARRFLGEFSLPPDVADAARLDAWLLAYCTQHATRDVPRKTAQRCGPLRDGETLEAALRTLAELDRVRVVKDGKRRTIELNPQLLGHATAIPATHATDAGESRKSRNSRSRTEGES